ncbi:glycosyltransferase family 2 protein [Cyanobacterium stanieri LEGE 03274]|uniref:Glycosyltransferase family 2 protein n=1 Tax=Cyanobacterium stanieri LEGE 03274 TaxID=1828756 RepID=A0ABR9V8B8_9CHRO|nr:glycosyltransferase family A protein [Cyanobacterium stanieri]MBE9223794.1 glycosyltransferase family 2 protein [Cyanobacterium stanieri LEGE 03274]
MLVFIVPLKSAKVSKSWYKVSQLLERTLKSICNQTSSQFKVLVVCHEKPIIQFSNSAVQYIQVTYDIPEHPNKIVKGLTDKGRKVLRGLVEAKKFNPTHIMLVDADDCVSSKLATLVEENPFCNGWYFSNGYKYLEGKPYIYIKRTRFYTLSGTANILKYDILDIPNHPEYNRGYGYYKFYLDHQKIPDKMKAQNFPLKPLPYIGAIYTLGGGENMSGNEDILKFNWLNRRKLTDKIRNEFALFPLKQ